MNMMDLNKLFIHERINMNKKITFIEGIGMNNKKIIIIIILLLIIVGAILLIFANSIKYEKVEITPNGTTIDVIANKTQYQGDVDGIKLWSWDTGVLVAFNSYGDNDLLKINEYGFNTINEIVKKGNSENIDGYTCYTINADDLLQIEIFNIIKLNYKGKFYCIPLDNQTSHDNIIICCNDKDIALHMAKSVVYKNVYPNDTSLDGAKSTVENITNTLESKSPVNLNEIKNKYIK